MDLKDRLKKIMEQEFGITTDEQLNEAFENMDMSDLGIFVKGNRNEVKRDSYINDLALLNAV